MAASESRCQIAVALCDGPIDVPAMLAAVADDDCGAQMLFLGCTRRTTGDCITDRLVYEAYRAMAEQELERIARQAAGRWPLRHVVIHHRLGQVDVGQPSVAIAVSSPHRPACMEAMPWMMDTLKQLVPIWKQETYADGSTEWIHP